MSMPTKTLAGCLFVAFSFSAAMAADLAALSVGSFTALSDGQYTAEAAVITETGRTPALALTISDFEAATSADKAEDISTMAGQFELSQPASMPIRSLNVVLTGSVVKEAGATASIEVKVAGASRVISWPESEAAAQAFEQQVTIELADGRLPSPFPVEAVAVVKKSQTGGEAVVSLKSIKVNLSEITTASTN